MYDVRYFAKSEGTLFVQRDMAIPQVGHVVFLPRAQDPCRWEVAQVIHDPVGRVVEVVLTELPQ